MSKKKTVLHVTIDQAKISRRVSRETFGSVKGSIAHKSKKDYDRNSKSSRREMNRIRKGEYE